MVGRFEYEKELTVIFKVYIYNFVSVRVDFNDF